MKPITREEIWNNNLRKAMKERGYSQRLFADEYHKKYGKGKQADVSHWLNVGELSSRSEKKRGFPAYETMKNIADLLGVDVGYLIGETNCETFNLEQASEFLGLPAETVSAIRDITFGKKDNKIKTKSVVISTDGDEYRFEKRYRDSRRTAAFSNLITSQSFTDYLYELIELAIAINNQNNIQGNFEKVLSQIPEQLRDDAVSLFSDSEMAIKSGLQPTDELWEYSQKLDTAAYEDAFIVPDKLEKEVDAKKYALLKQHIKLTDEIMTKESIDKMVNDSFTEK